MPGLFDDILLPQKKRSTSGLFDDLLEPLAAPPDFGNVQGGVASTERTQEQPLSAQQRNEVNDLIGVERPEPMNPWLEKLAMMPARLGQLGAHALGSAALIPQAVINTAQDLREAAGVGRSPYMDAFGKGLNIVGAPARLMDEFVGGAQAAGVGDIGAGIDGTLESLNPNANANRAKAAADFGAPGQYTPLTFGDRAATVGKFIAGGLMDSAPDMAGAVIAPWAYGAGYTDISARERAANDGREGAPNLRDTVVGAGNAALQTLFERWATKRLLPGDAETIAAPGVMAALGRIAKETGMQGGTEFIEEAGDYLSTHLGTEKGATLVDTLKSGAAGALIGGPLGIVGQGAKELFRDNSAPIVPPPPPPVSEIVTGPLKPAAQRGEMMAEAILGEAKSRNVEIVGGVPATPADIANDASIVEQFRNKQAQQPPIIPPVQQQASPPEANLPWQQWGDHLSALGIKPENAADLETLLPESAAPPAPPPVRPATPPAPVAAPQILISSEADGQANPLEAGRLDVPVQPEPAAAPAPVSRDVAGAQAEGVRPARSREEREAARMAAIGSLPYAALDGKEYTVADSMLGGDTDVRITVRADGSVTAFSAEGQGFDITNGVKAGMTPERALAGAMGSHQEGAEPDAGKVRAKGAPVPNPDIIEGESERVGPEAPSENQTEGARVREISVAALTLSQDVPQFKSGASDETGVVEPLGGTFDRRGVGPIQVWKRLDGRHEVISGRHRLDLARRSGEKTIPAQVYDEAAGFTKDKAASLDAELNIRDGQGKVKDYVQFFQQPGFDGDAGRQEADARGLLARATGRRAYTIASAGNAELIAAHSADRITDEAAVQVAQAAPKNDGLQNLGLKLLAEGRPIGVAVNTIHAAKVMRGPAAENGDLFGFDDSAIRDAVEMAKVALREQRSLGDRIAAIRGASKRPELARKEGVDVRDPAALENRLRELTADKARWDNWPTHADLITQVRNELGMAAPAAPEPEAAPEIEADPNQGGFELGAPAAGQADARKFGQVAGRRTRYLGDAEYVADDSGLPASYSRDEAEQVAKDVGGYIRPESVGSMFGVVVGQSQPTAIGVDPRQSSNGLFGAPSTRDFVDNAQRNKDAARDGKTGTGRTDMLAGDGALFAGPAPEQADVEKFSMPDKALDLSPTNGTREAKIGDTTITYGVSRDGQTVEVVLIRTPKAKRGAGGARRAMTSLLAEADANGRRVVLTPEPMDAATSKAKLVSFYRSLGFKSNTGRSRDFTTRAAMIREPAEKFSMPAAERDLSDIARQAQSGPVRERRVVRYGQASEAEIAAFAEAGVDVAGFVHVADSDAIRHALKAHGNPAAEASRGQAAITPEDIARIPEIVGEPDSVEPAGDTRVGRPVVRYRKRIGSHFVVVEEARTGQRQLAFVTMWKVPAAPDAPASQSSAQTSETFGQSLPTAGSVSRGLATPEALLAELEASPVGRSLAALEKAGVLTIIHDPAQRFAGKWDGRKATLNAAQIPAGKGIGVALHELGVHAERDSLSGILGDAGFTALLATIDRWADSSDPATRELAANVQRRVNNANTPAQHRDEERLAYAVELAANAGMESGGEIRAFLRRFAAYVKAWLSASKLGSALRARGLNFDLTPQDVAQLAAYAVARQARAVAPSRAPQAAEAFSIAPQPKQGVEYANGEQELISRVVRSGLREQVHPDGQGGTGLVPRKWAEPSQFSDKPLGETSWAYEYASRETVREESDRLIAAAKEHGFFWDSDTTARVWAMPGAKQFESGAEHDAYLVGSGDNRVVIRNTANGTYGPRADISPSQYLQRQDEYSRTFPALQARLIGVSQDEDGRAVIWTAQKFVEGREFATQAELSAAMAEHGWDEDGYPGIPRFKHRETGAVIEDAHTGNILHMDGELFPIDVVVETLPNVRYSMPEFDPATATSDSIIRDGRLLSLIDAVKAADGDLSSIRQAVADRSLSALTQAIDDVLPSLRPKPQRVTGIKNAVTDAERAAAGRDPILRDAIQTNEETLVAAMRELRDDPNAGEEVVARLTRGGEMSLADEGILLVYKTDLLNKRAAAADTLADADASESRKDVARQAWADTEAKIAAVDVAASAIGSEAGRMLQFRQRMLREDFTFAALERKERARLERPLTPAESATIKAMADTIAEMQAKVDALQARIANAESEGAYEDLVKRMARPSKQRPTLTSLRSKADAARARLAATQGVQSRRRQSGAVISPTAFYDLAVIGAYHVANGAAKFSDWVVAMRADIGAAFDTFKADHPNIFKASQTELEKPLKAEASVAEVMEKIDLGNVTGKDVRKLIEALVGEGMRGEQAVIAAAAEKLELEASDVRSLFVQTSPKAQPTLTEAQEELRDLRKLVRLQAEIDRITAGQPKPSRGPAPPDSPAVAEKKRHLAELRRSLKPVRDPEGRYQEMRGKQIEKRITELQDRIKAGDFAARPRVPRKLNEANQRAQYELDKVKEAFLRHQFMEMLKARSKWGKALGFVGDSLNLSRALMTSLDLSGLLRQGGFVTFGHPVMGARAFVQTLDTLLSERAQHAVMADIKARPNARLYEKYKLGLTDIGSNMGSLSKIEESYASRWIEKAALPSEKDGSVRHRLRLLATMPVRASGRVYVSFLNRLRADAFDALAATMSKTGVPTEAEAQHIADFVNTATGRGKIPRNWDGLNTVAFAPRLVASRFSLATFTPIITAPTGRMKAQIATEYARTLVGVGVVMSLLAYGFGGDDENEWWESINFDPRSADFMKLKFGDTRIDPFMGLSQVAVFMARLGTGETVTSGGDLRPLRSVRTWTDLRRQFDPSVPAHEVGENGEMPFGARGLAEAVFSFIRSKANPATGAAMNFVFGQNFIGEPTTVAGEAKNLLVPMSIPSIFEAMEDQGVPRGAALGLLSLFGMSLQAHTKSNEDQLKEFDRATDAMRDEVKDRLSKLPQDQWQSALADMHKEYEGVLAGVRLDTYKENYTDAKDVFHAGGSPKVDKEGRPKLKYDRLSAENVDEYRANAGAQPGDQAHHIIADNLVSRHKLMVHARMAGYDLNHAGNMIALPANPTGAKVGHNTDHPKYDAEVIGLLNENMKRLNREHGSLRQAPDDDVLDAVRKIEAEMRKRIEKRDVPIKDGRLAALGQPVSTA